jgi:polar amino acid transport system substrate-binding protein
MATVFLLLGCQDDDKNKNVGGEIIKFATCADYPPFEYYKNGNLTGFDIELAHLLAKKLGKTAIFEDMQFGAILVSVQNETVNAAISAIESSEEKRKECDFSNVYCKAGMALVYRKGSQATSLEQLSRSKVAYQNGCSIHMKLLKEKAPTAELIAMDKMNTAIESLKAGHVEYVFMDNIPAKSFCEKNDGLACSVVAVTEEGYTVMFKKGSSLKAQVDKALEELKSDGELEKLKAKWL